MENLDAAFSNKECFGGGGVPLGEACDCLKTLSALYLTQEGAAALRLRCCQCCTVTSSSLSLRGQNGRQQSNEEGRRALISLLCVFWRLLGPEGARNGAGCVVGADEPPLLSYAEPFIGHFLKGL